MAVALIVGMRGQAEIVLRFKVYALHLVASVVLAGETGRPAIFVARENVTGPFCRRMSCHRYKLRSASTVSAALHALGNRASAGQGSEGTFA